jgi:undecaprenyl phosphate-alpha-L-ara4FN deformylase
VGRTSVLKHYGLRTLLYGTLLPGPDIGINCAQLLREIKAGGFEVGIHCWDHVRWQDFVARADEAWTLREMEQAVARFSTVFGIPPRAWAAAGWQSNVHAARYQARAGWLYASDTRGHAPFRPVWHGEAVGCPQLPTTLPTLDELIGCDGTTEDNVADAILRMTQSADQDHVFTAHAELEGMRLAGVFERLLSGWNAQGYRLVSLETLASGIDTSQLPQHHMIYGEVPGRSGTLALQGARFEAP